MQYSKTIRLEPLDTLFFRDGRPFTMGDDTWASSCFPPFPSVIYGAVRSLYFADYPAEISKAGGPQDPTASLCINGIYLQRDGTNSSTILVPLPLDCVKYKDVRSEKREQAFLLSLSKPLALSNCPTEYVLLAEGYREVENVPEGLMDEISFAEYLAGHDNFNFRRIDEYVLEEPKIGIARDNRTLTAEEHKLYRVGMKRLHNLNLIVTFLGLEVGDRGFMKLGGEQKAVWYEKTRPVEFVKERIALSNRRFKLYLATPAIFDRGWLPGWLNADRMEGHYGGLRVKLLSAAVGKSIAVGGFDMKNARPKPMYRAVPAGSVYYFEVLDGDVNRVWDLFHGKTISEVKAEEGFGLSYVGVVNDV